MRKAVECWKAAQYWQTAPKEQSGSPSTRSARTCARGASRIGGGQAQAERSQADAQKFLKAYEDPQARTAKLRDGRDLLPALLQTWEGGLSYENQTRLKMRNCHSMRH